MGAVYLAYHELLKRRAAIKVLLPRFSHDAEIVDRFFREAKAATSIEHPGIVQIFDFGYHTDGSAYIVMEFLHGESLEERLERAGCLGASEAVRIVKQAARALAAAHAAGIVHRDLKPDNIFLVPDPEVAGGERAKVLDFGIAKLADPGHGKKTRTGAVMGTPTYMSPEQCQGAALVDHRSDVYSLGCVLFRLVCGVAPFNYAGIGELFSAHMSEPAPMVSACGGPPELDDVVHRMLQKSPNQRPQSMLEVVELLDRVPRVVAMSTPMPAGTASQVPINHAPDTTIGHAVGVTSAAPGPPSRRWALAAGALAVAAAIGIGAVLIAQSNGEPGESTSDNGDDIEAPVDPIASAAPPAAPRRSDPLHSVATKPPTIDASPAPITITIRSTPDGAAVRSTRDGEPVGRTPFVIERPAADGILRYWVTRNRYEPVEVTFDARTGGVEEPVLKRARRARREPKEEPKPKPTPEPDEPAPTPPDPKPTYDPGSHR